MLALKERQFEDAINAALGIDFSAVAQPAGTPKPTGPAAAFAAPPTMDSVVRGQTFDVNLRFTNHGSSPVNLIRYEIPEPSSAVVGGVAAGVTPSEVARDHTFSRTISIAVPADAPFTRPYFSRDSLMENRYTVGNAKSIGQPASKPPFVATAHYSVNWVALQKTVPVMRREAQLPYGYAMRELAVVPALALSVSPRQAIVPQSGADRRVHVQVEVTNNAASGSTGQVALQLPDGWTSDPKSVPFAFTRAGEKSRYQFTVAVPAIASREYAVQAVATANGHDFAEGYDVIEHRDLETRYLYHDAVSRVRGVDVKIAPDLKVGYVMGVGDDVPAGIAQLGAQVRLLEAHDLATSDLSQFDAVMTGTRAYAVRDDLRTYNRRLLDYVRGGGNLIVLYNTPAEFDPHTFAPYPADLPRNAEEVSEEDSPVAILTPARPEFTRPNTITKADFEGWVEQRGSKFFSTWDQAYTPMIETHDQGQAPQKGGWLTATYGKGHYTYFAYAFHRQLPYGVPGAYRLLANLLSLGRQ